MLARFTVTIGAVNIRGVGREFQVYVDAPNLIYIGFHDGVFRGWKEW